MATGQMSIDTVKKVKGIKTETNAQREPYRLRSGTFRARSHIAFAMSLLAVSGSRGGEKRYPGVL
jgi:hypothetical protein